MRSDATMGAQMIWLFTDENIATFIVVGGTFLLAFAGVLLGR